MEIKVNKEIRDYSETIFFGLSMRQFFFSTIACAVAVLLYFLLKEHLGLETLSWICILRSITFWNIRICQIQRNVCRRICSCLDKVRDINAKCSIFQTRKLL